jgi:hypothetical protein
MFEQMLSNSFYYQTVIKVHPDDHKKKLNWIIWGLFSGIVHPKQIFIPATGLMLTWAVSLRLFVKGDKSPLLKSVDIGVIIGFIYIALTSSIVPWHTFPFSKLYFIQLPWRLYEFVSYFFAVAGGYYLIYIFQSNRRLFAGAIMVILGTCFVISSSGRDFQYENSARKINQAVTKENGNYHLYGMEYVPSKFPSVNYFQARGDSISVKYDETTVSSFSRQNGITRFDIKPAKNDEIAELPLFYYKGYAANLNGKEIQVRESEHGLIEIPINEQGHVEVYYGGTSVQKISPFISILGIIALCVYIYFYKKKKYA